MLCCIEIQNLGCFTSCDTAINTGLTADVTGQWVAKCEFAGSIVEKRFNAIATQAISIPNVFNEDQTTVFKLYRPDGSQFGGICYSFKITPKAASL